MLTYDGDDADVAYGVGSMKGTNKSSPITPFSTVQKKKRERSSSATILPSSSSTNGTLKKKRNKRAKRDDDDDDDDDDDGGGDKEEKEEEAVTGTIRASWNPELVRTCMIFVATDHHLEVD